MPLQPLPALPDHSFIFIDANIFIYGLSGQSDAQTQNTTAVLSLITQFGGGKTPTLAALNHLIENAKAS